MIRKLASKGFTVIEMLVATSVASLLLILIMTFMTNTLVNNSIDTARADLLREAQLALDSIAREVRLSANVDEINRWEDENSPNAGPTNGYGWTSDDETMVLAISATDTEDNIIFQDEAHYITFKNNSVYFLAGTNLYRRTLAGSVVGNSETTTCPQAEATESCPADRRLVQNVTDFTVTYYDSLNNEVSPAQARSVELSLSLETEKYGRMIAADYKTRTVFRNE